MDDHQPFTMFYCTEILCQRGFLTFLFFANERGKYSCLKPFEQWLLDPCWLMISSGMKNYPLHIGDYSVVQALISVGGKGTTKRFQGPSRNIVYGSKHVKTQRWTVLVKAGPVWLLFSVLRTGMMIYPVVRSIRIP